MVHHFAPHSCYPALAIYSIRIGARSVTDSVPRMVVSLPDFGEFALQVVNEVTDLSPRVHFNVKSAAKSIIIQ